MSKVLVFRKDRRESIIPESIPQEDRRDFVPRNVADSELDDLISHCEHRATELEGHLRDKEKKKLTIIVSSFAVLSLVTTFSFNIAKAYAGQLDAVTTVAFGVALLGFLCAVAFVNIAIIKYVVALKMDCLLAIRQLNCNRQAIHTFLYAKWQRIFPSRSLNEMKTKGDFDGTILDRNTHFWRIYGRHEKYPLNNVDLRSTYIELQNNKGKLLSRLPYMPADIFAIYAIAVFTFVLLVLPMPVFILFADSFFSFSTIVALIIGAISIPLANRSWNLVVSVVDNAIDKIIRKLQNDEVYPYEPLPPTPQTPE